ncbi:alpha-galactosidase [Selaginella moellendorffii]|uniref:alpha-galactosidase n=1 Tax=Selaginella moellendorffii TaxID=88036 RepID=UPI000D1C4BE3|nr:alpha-galactosidase [Selaginella moellendorffii]|eukprot:XP_024519426.1 alpha-galactosidase [Selaginella moellendorffii]
MGSSAGSHTTSKNHMNQPAGMTNNKKKTKPRETRTMAAKNYLVLLVLLLTDLVRSSDSFERHRLLENGLGRTPPMGWNSWNYFHCGINEEIIRATTDAIVSTGLRDVGYEYVNIDDCWAELSRDNEGNLQARNSTFPSGIKALADYVHSKNLKFGIYSDAGYLTCQEQPGSLNHEDQDAKTFAAWGVDYLKYDNCHTDGSSPRIRYPIMRDALSAAGRPIFFSMCEWGQEDPATWASSVGNSWRTTGDIENKWESMISIADKNNAWAEHAAPGGWNDPDMLEIGNGGMSFQESRTHFSLWALMKAPLIIGCDVRNTVAQDLAILMNKEVIQINQDALGVQGRKVAGDGEQEVWGGPLSNGRFALLMLNRGSDPADITAEFAALGIPSNVSVMIRDVWKHQDLPGTGTYNSSITSRVESHDVAMYILTPV